jgi:hypothetical protein
MAIILATPGRLVKYPGSNRGEGRLTNHLLYTHAVEASPEPGKAAAAALRGKHPALGHLLPSSPSPPDRRSLAGAPSRA